MGKKASFVKDRQRTQHQQRQIRQKRGQKTKRVDEEKAAQRIAAPTTVVKAPSAEDAALIVSQPLLAARLPKPAKDLTYILQAHKSSAAGKAEDASPSKRTKKEDGSNGIKLSKQAATAVHAALLADVNVAIELSFDECGAQVVATLLRTLNALEMKKEASSLAAVFLKVSDDGTESLLMRMAEHHYARSVVWAAIEAASEVEQKKMFAHVAPAAEAASPKKGKKAAAVDPTRIKGMVGHRHGAITLQRFIQHYAASRTIIAEALLQSVEGTMEFSEMVRDPIAAPVVQALTSSSGISSEIAETLFAAVEKADGGVQQILEDPKRGPRVLISMLGEERSAGAERIAQAIYDIGATEVLAMATDNQKNFLFQRMLKQAARPLQKTLFDLVANTFVDMAHNGVGVHVCIAFTSCDNEEVRKALIKLVSPQLLSLVRTRHGSLFVRKFIENIGASTGNLLSVMDKDIPGLIFDQNGNLVVQQLLQHCLAGRPAQEKARFYERFIKDDIVAMCKHQFAAHVVVKLFDVLDAQLIADMSAKLRPEVMQLIQHVNGRFVVEKLVGPFKDVRDVVIGRFVDLSALKGTQIVLVRTYEVSDKKTRAQIIKNILNSAMAMATNQQSTLVLQKLIQNSKSGELKDEGMFHAEMKKHFEQSSRTMNALRQDFFGKFVAQML